MTNVEIEFGITEKEIDWLLSRTEGPNRLPMGETMPILLKMAKRLIENEKTLKDL